MQLFPQYFSFVFHLVIGTNDFTGSTAMAVFAQSTNIPSTQCASISTVNDNELEGNHDFTATISGFTSNLAGVVSSMAPLSSTVQINDDDGKM